MEEKTKRPRRWWILGIAAVLCGLALITILSMPFYDDFHKTVRSPEKLREELSGVEDVYIPALPAGAEEAGYSVILDSRTFGASGVGYSISWKTEADGQKTDCLLTCDRPEEWNWNDAWNGTKLKRSAASDEPDPYWSLCYRFTLGDRGYTVAGRYDPEGLSGEALRRAEQALEEQLLPLVHEIIDAVKQP